MKKINIKKIGIVFFIIIIIMVSLMLSVMGIKEKRSYVQQFLNQDEKYKSSNVDDVNEESKTLNVLVIEINPILTAITNKDLYKSNPEGHPKVSEYLQSVGEEKIALQEEIQDLEEASHGFLNIETTTEYLNEFPTYTGEMTLKNGKQSHSLDEETYLDMIGYSENSKGNWNNLWESEYYSQIEPYFLDYEYLINKFNLVERRNNNEFDQVWILSIDPSETYQTVMVGKNPYPIHDPPITKDCRNFMIANITISRRDANLNSLSHGIESIFKKVFGMSYDPYTEDAIDVSTKEQLESLNLWERFCLTDYNSIGNNASVGPVRYPFNGSAVHDYSNTNMLDTSWKDWENYPNLTGTTQKDNSNAWLTHPINQNLGDNANKDPDRLYTRFWLSLFPHIKGYTENGYYNNWWKYFYSLDYVESISTETPQPETAIVRAGDEIQYPYYLHYQSGEVETGKIEEGNNVQISNTDVINFVDGKLKALKKGTSLVTLYYDGQELQFTVEVLASKPTLHYDYDKDNPLSTTLENTPWVVSSKMNQIYLRDTIANSEYEYTVNDGESWTGCDYSEELKSFYISLPEGLYKIKLREKSSNLISEDYYYKADGTAPTLSVVSAKEANGEKEITINILEELSGLRTNTIEYVFLPEIEKPADGYKTATIENNQVVLKCPLSTDEEYYLYINEIYDNVGNAISGGYKFGPYIKDTVPPELNISYSQTNLTNQNVEVIITANEEIKEVEGWTLLEDRETIRKTYTLNGEETVKAYDLAGNEASIDVEVKNIDKIAPKLSIKYSTTEVTDGDVEVIITANEEIREVEGWALLEDRETIRKTYTSNEEETVKVYDLAGNSTEIKINVSNIIKKFNANDEKSADGTTFNGSLPYTGLIYIGVLVIVCLMIIVISYKKLKELREIK